MDTYRKTAIIAGVLFLLGYVGVFLGSAFYAPFLDAPDYLSQIYPNKNQVILGMLIELINDAAVIGIPVMLYPILKKYSERLALGYLGFRMIEAVILILSKTSVLSLITLSQEYLAAGSPDASYFQAIGAVALADRSWASQVQVVFFALSALIFYYALYQTKLLPRFLSVWGFVAVASLVAANLLPVPDLTEGFNFAQLLFLPIFLSEILVALWLIVKGFNPSAIGIGAANLKEERVPAHL
ncbi:MAG: DUF4386 family protein [Gammaproteobacteria bacterium]|nr:DUF4386 family protein [Gammaproteobacteria bacterium]